MSDRVYSDKIIEQCVSNLLPNKVLFALGDSDEVECASLWIKKLQAENKELEKKYAEAIDVIEFLVVEEQDVMDGNNWGSEVLLEVSFRGRQLLQKHKQDNEV